MILIVEDNTKELFLKKLGFECYSTNGSITKVIGFKNPQELLVEFKENEWLKEFLKEKPFYIATFDTMEGEKIASELYEFLKIDCEEERRILLKSMTPEGIVDAIAHPQKLRSELIKQFNQRLLENYEYAFNLSPLLWKCMSNTYEKKLTLNKRQFHVLQELRNLKTQPIKYQLRGFFSRRHFAFECAQCFDTLEECKKVGDKIKEFISDGKTFEIIEKPFNEVLTLEKVFQLNMSFSDVLDTLYNLFYNGYIEEFFESIHPTSYRATGLTGNEKVLYKYICSFYEERSQFMIEVMGYTFWKKTRSLTGISGNVKMLGLQNTVVMTPYGKDLADEESLRALDFKGFINLNTKGMTTIEYEEVDFFSPSSGVKSIDCNKSILEPLGYMVYQFVCNRLFDKKFEIPIDEHHSCIVGKYGLVVRNNETSSFLKLKENIDYEALYFKRLKLEDVVVLKKKKEEFIFFKGEEVILKKGKYGLYAQLGGKRNVSLKELGNRPLENIKKEEILSILEKSIKI
jgi:hypothetical protein